MIACIGIPLFAQEGSADVDEAMKKWKASIMPGAPHKALDAYEGSWETTTKIWMGGPTAPPSESKGTADIRWILGGRYLEQRVKSGMMGMPMDGYGLTGYDNMNKKYVVFWVDNLSTSMYTAEGAMDQSGKVLTVYGKMDEPMTGEHDKNVKYVTRMIDQNTFVHEIHDLAIGEPNTLVVEVTYRRKK